jgi:hypothetical protein
VEEFDLIEFWEHTPLREALASIGTELRAVIGLVAQTTALRCAAPLLGRDV